MARSSQPEAERAVRITARGRVQGVFMRASTVEEARELGLFGWVRNEDGGEVLIHAEGEEKAVSSLIRIVEEGPGSAVVESAEVEEVKPEGHEQFAIRGVSAGRFEVARVSRGFELRLEVEKQTRVWALPKGPSMDPAVKRMAFEDTPDQPEDQAGDPWDGGDYEQGGRVAWPEAIERGHAVFVLHGERLSGGFVLQRTRDKQWLLIKRSDSEARPGSDIVAESGA